MMFSIGIRDLYFFARPDETDHQGKKADGCESVEDVWHCVRIRLFFRLGDSPKSGKMVVRPIWTEEIGKCKHILVVPEVERLFA
jgi:hypothetical protein